MKSPRPTAALPASERGRRVRKRLAVLGAAVIFVALAVLEAWLSHAVAEPSTRAWVRYITRVDEALARGDVSTAVRAWHDAYSAALGSRHWEPMLDVGDAYLRIGNVSGFRKASEPKARQAYLTALVRARAQGSVEGVLRVAQAFAALGDREVVKQCLSVAEALADGNPESRARVLAFSAHMTEALGRAGAAAPP